MVCKVVASMAGGAAGRAPEHWEHNPKADRGNRPKGIHKLYTYLEQIIGYYWVIYIYIHS